MYKRQLDAFAAHTPAIAFWLDRGVAGFRIDMAFSLVKDDTPRNSGAELSARLWRGIRDWLDVTYPEAVIVPEGPV